MTSDPYVRAAALRAAVASGAVSTLVPTDRQRDELLDLARAFEAYLAGDDATTVADLDPTTGLPFTDAADDDPLLWPHEVPVMPLGPPRAVVGVKTASVNAALNRWWRVHLDGYHGAAARAGQVAHLARRLAAHHAEDGRTWDDLRPAEREHWRRYAATLLADDDDDGGSTP